MDDFWTSKATLLQNSHRPHRPHPHLQQWAPSPCVHSSSEHSTAWVRQAHCTMRMAATCVLCQHQQRLHRCTRSHAVRLNPASPCTEPAQPLVHSTADGRKQKIAVFASGVGRNHWRQMLRLLDAIYPAYGSTDLWPPPPPRPSSSPPSNKPPPPAVSQHTGISCLSGQRLPVRVNQDRCYCG